MSLGAGFAYLMGSVARGDGADPGAGSSSLTRYYAESGTPPGWWLGAGLAGLGDGTGLQPGSEVSEQQLWRLLGMLCDPTTGEPLGHRPTGWSKTVTQRIAVAVADLPETLSATDRAAAIARIEVRERSRPAPVAGFDLTFSVPKSVSTIWALAGPELQAEIHAAHRDAVTAAIKWAEEQVVFTRTGHAGLIQEPVKGVVAAGFDHWDSRAGDPHLHTHVVIANRVQTLDGRWRTLDSKTLHRYTVALSELHEGLLQDLLTERFGWAWTARPRQHSSAPRWDVAGVPVELIEAFSQRSHAIASTTDELITSFAAQHGRHPSPPELHRLRQQATLATRGDKQHHSLRDLCGQWIARATAVAPDARWLHHLTTPSASPDRGLGHGLAAAEVTRLGAVVLAQVSSRRATFSHANLLAETHRHLHGHPLGGTGQRVRAADAVVAAALTDALLLNPPDPAMPGLRLHKGADVYSTAVIFDAETRLLDAGRDTTGPALPHPSTDTELLPAPVTDDVERGAAPSVVLGVDQAAAVTDIATSGRRLDLLIGPAGTGKTTSLRALRHAWQDHYGPGSVVGLAPSAAAADVLAASLGIPAENTTKWLLEHDRTPDRDQRISRLQARIDACSSLGTVLARELTAERAELVAGRDKWVLRPGQLLIVDEASLAGTLHLDTLTTHATAVGAKVLLVGDPAQLGPVPAGGAFTMLTRDRDTVAELSDPRRFTEPWERHATLRLRAGDVGVTDTYLQHGRVHAAGHDHALRHVLDMWVADRERGLNTVMIAADHDSVTQLNHHARTRMIRDGRVSADGVPIPDGAAGVGDAIVTRRNNRTLRHGPGGRAWVRNGDTWTITATHPDGSLTARHEDGTSVDFDPGYVAGHVQLGYAITAHQAQGRTLDTAHTLITIGTAREALYVAATRGRGVNTLTADTTDPGSEHDVEPDADGRAILTRAIQTSTADTSAHAAYDGKETVSVPPTPLVAAWPELEDQLSSEVRLEL